MALEALYFIPWLQRLRAEIGIARERLIPIGRGGSAWWYDVPMGVELYHLRTPQQVRIEAKLQHAKRGMLKQTAWTPFERDVVRDAAESVGVRKFLTLHPGRMFGELSAFWEGHRGLKWVQDRLAFAPLTAPTLPESVKLPPQFVAVHFYARSTFPLSPDTTPFVTETIRQIAQATPVVWVGAGLHMDDHVDFPVPKIPNVFTLQDCGIEVTPQTNLATISAVLGKALGCVGTYGGTVQLAGRIGKPAIGFYTDWHGTALPHRHLSEALALQLQVPFAVLRLGEIPLLQSTIPMVRTEPLAPLAQLTQPA